jgi:hypothetical protein
MNESHPIRIPAGLDESDLLAWVEGEGLSRDREAMVARALDADPSLARQLGAMKRDRAALRLLPEERAPRGLVESAMAVLEPALERQMLLTMERGMESRPPVSIVRPVRRSLLATVFADRVARRFAAAAALLVTAGVATWVVSGYLAHPVVSPTAPGTVAATAGSEAPNPGVGVARDGLESPGLATLAQGPEASPAEPEPEAKASAVAAVEAASIDPARAVALACEHRLVIRVAARDVARASARLDGFAARSARAGAGGWRVDANAPAALASALLKPREFIGGATGRGVDPVLAGRALDEFMGPIMPGRPEPAWPVAAVASGKVYVVESRLEESALAGLLAALSAGGERAVFAESAEVLPMPPPMVNAAAVLWWSQPPTSWVPWASIPVVVEPGPRP